MLFNYISRLILLMKCCWLSIFGMWTGTNKKLKMSFWTVCNWRNIKLALTCFQYCCNVSDTSQLPDYFLCVDIKTSDWVSICTATMIGRHVVLVAKMKQVTLNIQGTHCMVWYIHRYILESKRVNAEWNKVLTITIKTVNSIKFKAFNSQHHWSPTSLSTNAIVWKLIFSSHCYLDWISK